MYQKHQTLSFHDIAVIAQSMQAEMDQVPPTDRPEESYNRLYWLRWAIGRTLRTYPVMNVPSKTQTEGLTEHYLSLLQTEE